MTRRMIEIEPGTESWNAWLAHHRGSKTELLMLSCRHQARPFYAWTLMPPDDGEARADRLSAGKVEASAPPLPARVAAAEGEIEKIAERLEQRAERDDAEQAASTARTEQGAKDAIAFERAAAAVQSGGVPKLNGLADIGMRMIDDPHELKRGRKPPPLRAKLVNLRDDPIGQMAKRGQVKPEQLAAARSWQALYDVAASVGGSRGIDPSAMKVDGGRFSDPINDIQIAAIKRLEQLDGVLGCLGGALVRGVLGDRMTIAQVAAMMGDSSARGTNHVGRRLRECLDTLVPCLGVEAKGAPRPVRGDQAEAADLARYADNPLLYRAVHEARRKIV